MEKLPLKLSAVLVVTINYQEDFNEMVSAGRYNGMHFGIEPENFPIVVRESGQVAIYLIEFEREVSSDEALSMLEAKGMRPAEMPELLALGAQHPEEQVKGTEIVGLGSVWWSPYWYDFVPYLGRGRDEAGIGQRQLGVCRSPKRILDSCRVITGRNF